jgi:molybdopterin synthase sulfur carrier subunit
MYVEFTLRGTFAEAAGVAERETRTVGVDGETVGDALGALAAESPDLRPLVVNSDGKLRGHVALRRNGADVRDGEWLETPVSDGDRLTLEPGVKGGC